MEIGGGRRRKGQRLLYWFRTPPGVRVGRAPIDQEAIRLLEQHNPDVQFDWTRILKDPPPDPQARRERERDPRERDRRERRDARPRPRPSESAPLPAPPASLPAAEGSRGPATALGDRSSTDATDHTDRNRLATDGTDPTDRDRVATDRTDRTDRDDLATDGTDHTHRAYSATDRTDRSVPATDSSHNTENAGNTGQVFSATGDSRPSRPDTAGSQAFPEPEAPPVFTDEDRASASYVRLGAEGLGRLRARYAEVLARIAEKPLEQSAREELKLQAERLNPDGWVTTDEVSAALEQYETVFEGLRSVVGRHPRRRRRR